MEEAKVAPAAYATPAANPESGDLYVQKTPTWVVVVRGFQVAFSFIILAMCGYLIHGKAMDANVFALVVCLMTWIVVGYVLVTEKVPSANGAYNIWAVIALDALMTIFWLASMGANAAQRTSFKYDVDIEYCYNDGSAVSSNHCVVSKRDLAKRAAVSGPVGLAVMSAIAGLSAIVMLLFIATLVFHGHTFRLYNESKKSSTRDNATVEMHAQKTPMLGAQQQQPPSHAAYTEYQSQTQHQQAYSQTGYPPQTNQGAHAAPTVSDYNSPVQAYQGSYSPQQQFSGYPQSTPSPAPVSTPSPAPYELAQQNNGQQQHAGPYQLPGSQPYGAPQQQYQQPYSPHGTPAPGQPYYPPQQQ
jgi:hypothetical protein